jgi:hypothetical protein
MHTIEQVEELRTKARAHVHNMVQLAYDAGRQRGDAPGDVMRPSAHTVNSAVDHVELAAVKLAHARMEETAKRCGFEGLTEALGYLVTLRDNPVAALLREAVNLAALGDIDENTEAYGWGHWYKRAKAVVGDTAPPPETIKFETHDEVAIERRPEPQVLSGCAVRAAIRLDNTMPDGFVPTASALRGRDGSGRWLAANVHDLMYSTVSMLASEYYDGEKWVPVGSEDDARNGGGATTN